jgi:beta-glucosidase
MLKPLDDVSPVAVKDLAKDFVWGVSTSNGAGADEKPNEAGEIPDHERIAYLKAHTYASREAVAAGADIRGYFVWSLRDNFDWGAGCSNRFGLVYVDYPTQRRIPKESAHWYARLIGAEAMRAAG